MFCKKNMFNLDAYVGRTKSSGYHPQRVPKKTVPPPAPPPTYGPANLERISRLLPDPLPPAPPPEVTYKVTSFIDNRDWKSARRPKPVKPTYPWLSRGEKASKDVGLSVRKVDKYHAELAAYENDLPVWEAEQIRLDTNDTSERSFALKVHQADQVARSAKYDVDVKDRTNRFNSDRQNYQFQVTHNEVLEKLRDSRLEDERLQLYRLGGLEVQREGIKSTADTYKAGREATSKDVKVTIDQLREADLHKNETESKRISSIEAIANKQNILDSIIAKNTYNLGKQGLKITGRQNRIQSFADYDIQRREQHRKDVTVGHLLGLGDISPDSEYVSFNQFTGPMSSYEDKLVVKQDQRIKRILKPKAQVAAKSPQEKESTAQIPQVGNRLASETGVLVNRFNAIPVKKGEQVQSAIINSQQAKGLKINTKDNDKIVKDSRLVKALENTVGLENIDQAKDTFNVRVVT